MAFRVANGSAKELSDPELVGLLRSMAAVYRKQESEEGRERAGVLEGMATDLAAKCEDMPHSVSPVQAVEIVEAPKPFGGATSFDDIDAFQTGMDTAINVSDQKRLFDSVWGNIWDTDDLTSVEKQQATARAAADLVARITNPPAQRKSFLDRFLEVFGIGNKIGVPSHSPTKLEETSWDGGGATTELRKWASSDSSGDSAKISWSKYRQGFSAYDSPGEKFGDFWGPHHRVKDGSLVTSRAGVVAAFAAAGGARSGAKRPDALAHLNSHRRQFGIGQAEMEDLSGVSFKELGLPDDSPESTSAFSAFKNASGQWRWLAVTTNKYEDREGEIFSERAHKAYVAYVDESKDYPELWLWHTPGTRCGKGDLVDYCDGFVIHSGYFDAGKEDIAQSLARKSMELRVSHGYQYLEGDEKDGIYDVYKTFEVSPLPAGVEANAWTTFETNLKEVKLMGFNEKKRAFLVEHMGEERVSSLEGRLGELAKEIEASGVSFKDLSEALEEKPAVTEVAKPEEKVGETVGEKPAGEPEPNPLLAISEQLTTIGAQVQTLATAQKELVDGLDARVDTAIQAALGVRRRDPAATGLRPTESEKNLVDEEKVKSTVVGTLEEKTDSSPARAYVNDLLGIKEEEGVSA